MKSILTFIATILVTTQWVAASPDTKRPNILLLLVDDLKPAIHAYDDPTAITPHMDALAKKGMRFNNAYCNEAVCAPSRFSLMLGSHPSSTGLYTLGNHLRRVVPDAITMPQYFAQHGYRTESLGKIFHIGHGNLGDPDSFSVPHFKEKVIEYRDPKSTPNGQLTREEAMFQNQKAPPEGMNSLPRGAAFESPDVEDDAYADGRVAEEAIKRLQAATNRDEPFFMAVGFARPHLPFSAPKKYWDLYNAADLPMPHSEDLPTDSPEIAGKRGGEIRNYFPVPDKNSDEMISDELSRQLIHGYYASISYVDAQIGKVLKGLNELGLHKNTIVVLWGDHGFHLGDLGIWTKHTNYEQANRIPLIFAGPNIAPGSSTDQLAESVDVFPTLASLTNLPAPKVPQPIDGVSLKPVIDNPENRVRDHAFHVYPRGKEILGRAVRTDRFRLVEWKKPGDLPENAQLELYDYSTDPSESRNLASDHPQVVADLRQILEQYPEAKPLSKQKKASSVIFAGKKKVTIPDAMVAPVRPAMKAENIKRGLKERTRALFIKAGWIRDPYITLGPDDFYYLTGTTMNEGDAREKTDPYNIGLGEQSAVGNTVRVWKSKDLVDWHYLGTPFTLSDSFHKEPGEHVWAPELHWLGDKWALVHCPKGKFNLAFTKWKDVAGPWAHPMGDQLGKKHDPSLFKDGDRWWMLAENTTVQPIKPDFSGYSGPATRIDPSGMRPGPDGKPISRIGHEGATMIKVGQKYVHFGTAWSTDKPRQGSYNLYYSTADKITGPYGPRKFAGRFLGHGTPFQTRDGKWWCTAFFNANKPPLDIKGIQQRDLSETAQTINHRGVTIVPLEVKELSDGEVYIRAIAPSYANPGPDEAQKFSKPKAQAAQGVDVDKLMADKYPTVEGRWGAKKANNWYDKLPWLVGCNYYPATAINQIEMWQKSTFDPQTIDKELGWAAEMGMNTLRVYLHDLVWAEDEEGLYQRMDTFLSICEKHSIRPFFVFFDDCHFPRPKLGEQPRPVKAFHNSGWVNSPSRDLAYRFANDKATDKEVARLKGYVQKTIRRFANDKRVLFWELYNEPGRGNSDGEPMEGVSMGKEMIGDNSQKLVHQSWVWAREIAPSQPISSNTAGSVGAINIAINRANSDIHSIHSYAPKEKFEALIKDYQSDGRPILMTEWLARERGNTVEECLPIMKKHRVAAINWGFVSGKTGTVWPWSSRDNRNLIEERSAGKVVMPGQDFPEPEIWFHDLLRIDGSPYRAEEIKLFKALTKQ